MLLDQLTPKSVKIHHGNLGLAGQLGYPVPGLSEDSYWVSVRGRTYTHAVSAHPPSSLIYELEEGCNYFHAYAALNDTAAEHVTADFLVYADGILVAVAASVHKKEPPREILANISGAKRLELRIETDTIIFCHALWIDMSVHPNLQQDVKCPLDDFRIPLPREPVIAERCISAVVTSEYADMMDDMLGSLYLNGGCKDATVVLFMSEPNQKCRKLAEKYNAISVVFSASNDTFVLKTAAYCAPLIVVAEQYMVLDADMMILGSVEPIFNAIRCADERTIFICREQGVEGNIQLKTLLSEDIHPYFSAPGDEELLRVGTEGNSTFIVNAGLLAGTRRSMLALDNMLRNMMPFAAIWHRAKPEVKWRDQGLLNLALARMRHIGELQKVYNIQLLQTPVEIDASEQMIIATLGSQLVKVLHFNGTTGKEVYQNLRGKYAYHPKPQFGLIENEDFSSIAKSIHRVLRAIENKPLVQMAYGSSIAPTQHVDSYREFFELLQVNQPQRVLEIGCRVGLTTMCIATAMTTDEASIISIDSDKLEEKETFFNGVHEKVKSRIRFIYEDQLIAVKQIVNEQEKFDMIIFDTFSNSRHALTLFLMSKKILTEDGSIFVHDSKYPICTIEDLNHRMKREGWELTPISAGKSCLFYKATKCQTDGEQLLEIGETQSVHSVSIKKE